MPDHSRGSDRRSIAFRRHRPGRSVCHAGGAEAEVVNHWLIAASAVSKESLDDWRQRKSVPSPHKQRSSVFASRPRANVTELRAFIDTS
jgi:hypothetical protein